MAKDTARGSWMGKLLAVLVLGALAALAVFVWRAEPVVQEQTLELSTRDTPAARPAASPTVLKPIQQQN